MNIPLDHTKLELEAAIWRQRLGIAWERLRVAKRNGRNKSACLAALKDIKTAEVELKAVKNLLALCDKQGELAPRRLNPLAVEAAAERVQRILSPRPSAPQSDRKRDKRLRDRELRGRMKGPPRSDDSKHGRRKKVRA